MSVESSSQLHTVVVGQSPPKFENSIARFWSWLRSWKDVVIAELLNLFERRRYDYRP